jgi:SagB-type dehydrogenase family enzyme
MSMNKRPFLRSGQWEELQTFETDQKRNVPPPPIQKPAPEGARLIPLVSPRDFRVGQAPLVDVIRERRSERVYTDEPLSFEEISFLLWATQGISKTYSGGLASLRTVPSAGARHPFETYLLVQRVEELDPGLYRYLPLEHAVYVADPGEHLPARIHAASYEQYVQDCAVAFIWTAVPYRTEWRYGAISPKLIALDAGHLCQNLYLGCVAIGAGACAIGAYDQTELDQILDIDGFDELAIYMATVGMLD